LQVRVHELRRALGDPARVAYRQGGYALALAPGELDAAEFGRLVADGRAAATAGGLAAGAGLLRHALVLWRGPALAGQDQSDLVRNEAARLEELRWQAAEDLADAELALGRAASVAMDLGTMVAEQPFREGLRARYMLALYRLGRSAEALESYREGRRLLVGELGVEPGRPLRELHQAILASSPQLELPGATVPLTGGIGAGEPPAPKVVPAELPPDVAAFTGRRAELRRQRAGLLRARGRLAVWVISGPGGAGKSALAVHAAHSVGGAFPDGQLWADLRGATAGASALCPAEVLGRFLRALGIRNPPHDAGEAAARFRSLTADRRILVVLDNAAGAAQVRPLLPGGTGCAVLITSRAVLSTLDGARHEELGMLSEDEAMALLGRAGGDGRVAAEPGAAAEIARYCGYLPLAIRICAAWLAAHPLPALADYARRLSDAGCRLDQLSSADLAVRASIAASQNDLQARPGGSSAFRLLALMSLLDTADIGVATVAALAGQAASQAQHELDLLAETQLLHARRPDRYQMHDLIRLYAREHARAHVPQPERLAAIQRALAHYAAVGARATELADPGQARWLSNTSSQDAATTPAAAPPVLQSAAEAMAWLDAERGNLVPAARQAATLPGAAAALAIQLAAAVTALLDARGYWRERAQLNELARDTARRLGDHRAEARAAMFLSHSHVRMGHPADGLSQAERSLALWRSIGDRLGESGALNACANAYGDLHRHRQAIDCLERSLAIRRQLADGHGEVMLLNNLGWACFIAGQADRAAAYHQRDLALSRQIGDLRGQSRALGNLGDDHRAAGRHDQAISCYHQSLGAYRQLGDRLGEARRLWSLGNSLHELGQPGPARSYWDKALAILQDLGFLTADQAAAGRSTTAPPLPEPIASNW
jgi:DNA-binding SARP family transcriptional activator/tetratricopeptide (TPR) repeat protein